MNKLLLITLMLSGCNMTEVDKKVNCVVECDDCKNLKIDCSAERDQKETEVTG